MIKRPGVLILVPLAVLQAVAHARGVTPYLPSNLDPEVERQVERVLILGDKPVLTRPIPAAVVIDALPKACEADPVLCERVRKFLSNYMHASGIEFASIEGSASTGSTPVMPNEHGRTEQSRYQVAAAGYLQMGDYALVNVGGVAYQGKGTPTGSMLSLGFDRAQLDIGYRDHWWSPMTDSAMLISTEAPTMPSFTLSNYEPLTRVGFRYEAFLAQMSESSKIQVPPEGYLTRGHPKFSGLHFSIEPAKSGWSFGVNRIIVFGGGAAGGQSFTDIVRAFFNPSKAQTTGYGGPSHDIGKQEASFTSRFIFPGPMPFAVYFEYAGNDTLRGRNYLLGKPDLSAGVHFPRVGPFDITYEISEWSNTWYVHTVTPVQTGYLDGLTNYRRNIGHWFGDQRQFGDAVGGQSNMLRVAWEPPFGGRLEAQIRTLANDSYYSAIPYRREWLGSVSYAHPWREYAVGAQIDSGRDVFGGHYTRLAGFLRYGDALRRSSESADDASTVKRPEGAEVFVDAGVNGNKVLVDVTAITPRYSTKTAYGPHLAVGARREVSRHQDLGVRIEADDIQGRALISVRAIDYRYRFKGPLALSLFGGASRYALATPAFGLYVGTGVQWREVLPGWDLGVDYRYASKVSRQRVLPTDPQGGYRPEASYDVNSVSMYVSRKF
jgi:hypothetical protein